MKCDVDKNDEVLVYASGPQVVVSAHHYRENNAHDREHHVSVFLSAERAVRLARKILREAERALISDEV